MSEPRVQVFFYGSYMNPAVLSEMQVVPERFVVARLDGYDIRIAPRANLEPSSEHCVWGVLIEATHAELQRLYAHARDVLGETYLPHPVLTRTREGAWLPAMCYLAASMAAQRPDPGYVDRIIQPARSFGFPDWYVRRLEAARGSQ